MRLPKLEYIPKLLLLLQVIVCRSKAFSSIDHILHRLALVSLFECCTKLLVAIKWLYAQSGLKHYIYQWNLLTRHGERVLHSTHVKNILPLVLLPAQYALSHMHTLCDVQIFTTYNSISQTCLSQSSSVIVFIDL